jgi:hypothetical protein
MPRRKRLLSNRANVTTVVDAYRHEAHLQLQSTAERREDNAS